MMHGDYQFGELSDKKEVIVSSNFTGTEAVDNAAFVEQTVQKSMLPGKEYKVMITLTNTGTVPWTPGKFRLLNLSSSPDGKKGNVWGRESIEITETIPVGATKVFNFKVNAPDKKGSYSFQWRMSSDAGLFGDASTEVVVNVNNEFKSK